MHALFVHLVVHAQPCVLLHGRVEHVVAKKSGQDAFGGSKLWQALSNDALREGWQKARRDGGFDQISEGRDFPAVTCADSWRVEHAIRARAKFSSRQGDIPRICNLSPERRARASGQGQSWCL